MPAKPTKVLRHCEVCGAEFLVKPCEVRRRGGRFCGRPCMFIAFTRPPEDRFWEKVNKDGPTPAHRPELGPCWVWTGGTTTWGYGVFLVKNPQSDLAHRYSWLIHNGPIPSGQWVLHHCDNPACVRPDHHFLGTPKDNSQDMARKGRCGPSICPERIMQGELNGASKLNPDKVRAMRSRYAAGGVTLVELGREYGVSHSAIARIVTRKGWTHVA